MQPARVSPLKLGGGSAPATSMICAPYTALCSYVVSVNWSAEMVKAALAQEGLNVVVAGAG